MAAVELEISDVLIRMESELDQLKGQVGNLEARVGSVETVLTSLIANEDVTPSCGEIWALDTHVQGLDTWVQNQEFEAF